MILPEYSETKPSEFRGLSDVPAHWDVVRGRFFMQVNPPSPVLRKLKGDDEVSFVPMEAVGEYGGLSLDQTRVIADASSGFTEFQDGDVVVAKITPCFENGKAALAAGLLNGAALGTTELHVLRAQSKLHRGFLFYIAISDRFQKLGESEMYGAGGQKRVPPEFCKDFPMPLPPFAEQEQIAAFLDWKTGQIDKLIARKKALLEKLKEKRIAVITQAVTQGLNPAAAMRDSGIPWLGKVPQHWRVIPLGFLMTMSGGMTPSMANSDYWDGDIPWVTPKDMKLARISDSIDHLTETALMETSIALIPLNAVLIVVRGMILAHSFPTAINEVPVTINQDMKALRCNEGLEVAYLFWCLNGFAKVLSNLAQESAHGTRKMETETLKKFCIPVPPVNEQVAITAALQTHLHRLDQLADATESTVDRLTEYRAALITAATTGKIDVRNVVVPA
ncbi:restriction endonuclease subunit S [Casimicrobium huifangae]|uniref:restriction endonuclease subunit S n=1 Tax=Casimicrobium huifangae TaxID=2591109 RepID=UPI003784E38C